MSAAVVHGIRVRPLEVPLAQPVELAGGAMTTAPVVLVDVLTGDGRCGHSYLRTYSPLALRSLAALVEDLADVLVGQPATPETVERALPHTLRLLGTRGLVGAALAAFDIALWDIRAQTAGRPLAHLLGGEVDRIRAYATIRSRDPRTAAEEAHAAAESGFAAVKVKLGGRALEDDERLVEALRAAVGAGVDVLGDFNQSLTVDQALARAAQLDELGLAWIEEPTRADDLAGHARIRQALRTPIQLGENLEGTAELARSIDAKASDLLMLDAVKIGGVTGWRRAASLAADAGLRVSSHGFPEVSVHLLAGTPTAHWLEHLDHLAPIRASGLHLADGHLRVPRRRASVCAGTRTLSRACRPAGSSAEQRNVTLSPAARASPSTGRAAGPGSRAGRTSRTGRSRPTWPDSARSRTACTGPCPSAWRSRGDRTAHWS